MNDLQRLLKLRGISCRDIAEAKAIEYHTVQKTIARAAYTDKRGVIRIRKPKNIRRVVADYLGLSYDQVWGDGSALTLRRLIKAEVRKKAQAAEAELMAAYLPNVNVSDGQVARNG